MRFETGKLRVGVIGVGYLGGFHAEKYAAMEDVDLVSVVDLDTSLARKIAENLKTDVYRDYRSLIGQVDAASIVTTTPAHYRIGRDLLTHGIDVMIEKPITETVEQADELIQLAEQNGRILQVGHLERFNPAFAAVKERVRHPLLIESCRKCIFKKRGTDVSVVLDMMIHDIDLVLSLVHSEITGLKAAGMRLASGSLDVANVHLEFAEGCAANLIASRIASANERRMDIFQPDARIAIDFSEQKSTIVRKKETARRESNSGVSMETVSHRKGDALREELKAFVRAVNTRETPVVNGEMGRNALKLALDIIKRIEEM